MPLPGTVVDCTGVTNNQNNPNGYGDGTQNGLTINIQSGATVQGQRGLFLGDNNTIANSGLITGAPGAGVVAASATINNSGTISSTTGTAVTVSTTIFVPSVIPTVNYLTNFGSGTIIGQGDGVHVGDGIQAGTATIHNLGNISGTFGRGVIVSALTNVTVVNSGTISSGFDGAVYVAGGSATILNSGTLTATTGPAIHVAAGSATVVNSGTITGAAAGGVAIRFASPNNILTLAPGSAINGIVSAGVSDTLQLGGTGNGTFDVSLIGAAQQYRDFGIFNKVDASTWTITGSGTYTAPTNVNGGTLIVDGSIATSSLTTVNSGGTLGGNGTVGNTFINGGTLSPGHSVGTLTVSGSLAFTAAATYLVEISGPTADRINVAGAAALGGASVNTSVIAGGSLLTRYTILNAAGGVTGTFGGSSTNLSTVSSSLSYDTNNVYLNLALNFANGSGLNGNQAAVGNALTNFFNTTGGIPFVFTSLTPAGLTQVSGETATGSQQTTFNAMSQFLGLLLDPFIGGRGDTDAAATRATPFVEEDDAANAYASTGRKRTSAERDAYAAVYRKASIRDIYDPRWSVWAAGFGGSQTTNGNTVLGSNDTTSRVFGMAAGADYIFSPRTIAGFALAGGGTNFSVVNGGTGRSDLFQAGAFVRHKMGAAYVYGALAYGWQDITTDRTVTIAGIDRLRAQFNANAFSGRIEGGYRFVAPWMGVGITPYAAGQFTTFDLPAYAEQVVSGANTFALAYASKSVTATRSELGIRADKSYVFASAILTLRGRAAWAHDYNDDRNVGATFQTLPGASFVVNGAAQARDAALTTASAEMKWHNGWSAAGTFEGEFSPVTKSYAGKGVVRYSW